MKLKQQYSFVLRSNQKTIRGFRYTVPAASVYPYQWLWDSCFQAIIYLKLNKLDYAKDEIRALLSGQWTNGMIPHMIYWKKLKKHIVDWGTNKNTSSITQPPMIAYAAERIYQASKDKVFVKEVFDKLDKYYKWLHQERSDNFILSIIHPWESGEDDFVPWDNVLNLNSPGKKELRKHKLAVLKEYMNTNLDAKKFMKKNIFNVKCLLFNAVYLRNLKSMYELSKIVKKEEKYYKELIIKAKAAIKKELYNKKAGLFTSRYNKGQYIKDIKSSSIFLPLFAGLLTKAQADKLIKSHLLNNTEFRTPYPIPTISADNDNFQPGRYWRGSAWININWFAYKGLIDYGFKDVAQELKKRSVAMVKKSGFCEYYHSINGKGLGPYKFSWSGLIFDMC